MVNAQLKIGYMRVGNHDGLACSDGLYLSVRYLPTPLSSILPTDKLFPLPEGVIFCEVNARFVGLQLEYATLRPAVRP